MRLLLAWDDAEDVVDTTLAQFTADLFPDLGDALAIDAREDHARIIAAIEASGMAEGVSQDGRDFVVGTPLAVAERFSRSAA